MNAWCWRLIVILLIGVIFLSVSMKRHIVFVPQRSHFLKYTTGHFLVRVVDTDGSQAIYRFPDGATVCNVKNMTINGSALDPLTQKVLSKRLKNGDVVEFTGKVDRISGIVLKNMAVAERIVLCIPLDPDEMSLDDWMYLPGVGRSLAEAIVADRQKNGGFCSFERVSRVPGMGSGRIKSLEKFFLDR